MENADSVALADESNAALLKTEFDALARGALRPGELIANVSDICRGNPEATWDALSLIDQYHRRGVLDTESFVQAKTALNAIAFGARPDLSSTVSAADHSFEYGPFPFTKESPRLVENNLHIFAPRSEAEILTSLDASSDTAAPPIADVAKQPLRATAVLMDRYVLIDPIHSTATATIFKAFDRKRAELADDERFVSVKALNASVAHSPEVQQLLQDEFSQSKNLSHPNILATYDYHADREASFLVQGLLQGQPLSRLIEQHAPRRILKAHALAIVRDIGLALAYAHEKQIVHGALSTDTVVIGANGTVRVFGFGSNGLHQQVISARTGIDISGDVFSLACIAYELLAGHAPFIDVDHQQERCWARIESLSREQWRQLERGLQPHRSQRPTSIREWVVALAGDDAATFLPSYDYIATEIPKRRSWLPVIGKMVAAIVFIAVLAGGAYLVKIGAFNLPVRSDSNVAQALLPPEATEPAMARSVAQTAQLSTANSVSTDSREITVTPSPRASLATQRTVSIPPGQFAARAVDGVAPSATAADVSPPISGSDAKTNAASNAAAIDKNSQPALDLPAKVSFTTDRIAVASNESVARINIVRRGGTARPVVVKWRTLPGSAKPDTDYAATLDGETRIPAGETHAAIVVPIVHGDAQQQASKWFDVEITDVTNASLSSIATATVLIVGADVEQRSASQ